MPETAVAEDTAPGAGDPLAATRAIERFVPRFARAQACGSQVIVSSLDLRLSGAILVADIAGFSTLTEIKARLGQAGIEEMQSLLNRCFDRIVSTLTLGGGEICRFAGDATIACWPAGGDPHGLRTATHAAAATALRLQALIPELAQALQPAVLRMIRQTAVAAQNANIWVGMCGELAGNALATPLLLGLGLTELSMAAPSIPAVKAALRHWTVPEAEALAAEVLGLDSVTAVQAYLESAQK